MFFCVAPLHAQAPATQPVSIPAAIDRGVKFLEKFQSPDGSWGTGRETRGTEIYSMVPGSLDSFRIGASALCVMALREAGEKSAHDKGLEFLLTAPDVKRDDGALLYNTWAYIYVLQAMSEEILHGDKDPRVLEVAKRNLKEMDEYSTYMGGWAYYDFDAHTQSPSMGPTCFGTAAGLVALFEAKQAGIEIPGKLIKVATRQLEKMRLPTGVFLYGADYLYHPTLPANRPRGAFGRTQPANYALWLWKSKEVNSQRIKEGLDLFFKEHTFLDMGRKRPWPHESWYQTSGYYYYFDHYYASRLLEALDAGPAKTDDASRIAAHVFPHQEEDGSWWDYAMWDFHKPYGTAFAIMTLLRCEPRTGDATAEAKPAAERSPATRSAPFEKEIEAFEAADKKSAPPQGAVLFVGDSAIRMWKTAAQDFPDQTVINRGFGGSQLSDSVHFADRIVIPYKPRLIVLKAGGNDLTAGKTPERILGDFQAFVEKVRAALPDVRIVYLGSSPNPARWSQAEKRKKANGLIKAYVESGKNLDFVEVWNEFLGPDGKPREDIFLKDRLHNNADGYKILADAVRPHLK
ncbi:MAG TPA: GDSL-type esterase/lipase family protein [Tepidisphaeraceae bacterium]|nr:GDSL-type esterase/lipase family protein [Tepidisphaeraceae bacterium]